MLLILFRNEMNSSGNLFKNFNIMGREVSNPFLYLDLSVQLRAVVFTI